MIGAGFVGDSKAKPAAIAFDSVSFSVAGAPVLEDINLELPEGSLTAILGESGSGKTTLLNHINGLLRPLSGSISLFGSQLDYSDLPRVRRGIGYALQSVGLLPHLSVADNITLAARLTGLSEIDSRERLAELMSLLRLPEELGDRYPHQLSGGQQQRAGICRSMMQKPRLLLLDEPFSGVDPITRMGIHESFLRLRRSEPATCVMVTHDVAEATALAQHLVVLRQGRVIQSASIEEVRRSPADDSVARLLETAP